MALGLKSAKKALNRNALQMITIQKQVSIAYLLNTRAPLMQSDTADALLLLFSGEVIEMHFCQALRKPDSQTSYWNKY